jgi:hypothetical protein
VLLRETIEVSYPPFDLSSLGNCGIINDMRDEAVGTYEAAGLLAMHFSKPKRLAEQGVLSSRAVGGQAGREFLVYSSRECDENYRDYERNRRDSGGVGRPRTAETARTEALRRLGAKDRVRISFGDAIGVEGAAKILGVYWTLVPRLAAEGKISGRILWSERASRSRLWIFSRESCEKRAAEVKRQEEAGTKRGRPRLAANR